MPSRRQFLESSIGAAGASALPTITPGPVDQYDPVASRGYDQKAANSDARKDVFVAMAKSFAEILLESRIAIESREVRAFVTSTDKPAPVDPVECAREACDMAKIIMEEAEKR